MALVQDDTGGWVEHWDVDEVLADVAQARHDDLVRFLRLLEQRRPEWHGDAACREHPDPSIWFPARGASRTAEARAVCAGCLARDDCDQWADEAEDPPEGIWAGVTFTERKLRHRARQAR